MGKALISAGVCFGCAYSLITHDLTSFDRLCFVLGFMGGVVSICRTKKQTTR
jgi:hypothetical protein